jgi:hypothetical protein
MSANPHFAPFTNETAAARAQRCSIEVAAARAAEVSRVLMDRARDLDEKAQHCVYANRLRKYAEADGLREEASLLRRLARHAGYTQT